MWYIKKPLNRFVEFITLTQREEMVKATKHFIGKHDFASFCNIECVKNNQDTERELERFLIYSEFVLTYRLDLIIQGDVLTFEFEAPGFLYNQIRIIVGTIVTVCNVYL